MTIEVLETPELAPEPPPAGPRVWVRDNLFSSPASIVLTVVATLLVLGAYSGLLGFVFAGDRRWDAVTFNMRLLMVQAYPTAQFARVWASVGILIVLLAATLAIYRVGGRTTRRKLGGNIMVVGAAAVLGGLVGPWGLEVSPVGIEDPTTVSTWVGVGVVVLVAGYLTRTLNAEQARKAAVPVLGVAVALITLVLIAMWTIELPFPARAPDGTQIIIQEPVAMSTRVPWTVLAAIGVVTYLLVKLARDRIDERTARNTITGLWIVSFPVIVLVILRDPDADLTRALTWYVPVALGFGVVGGFLLNFIASQKGELGRILAAVLVVVALGSILVPMEWLIRFLLLLMAVFALLAPSFGGEGSGRRRYLGGWLGTVTVVTLVVALITAPSTVDVASATFLGGLALTLVLSVSAIVLSFPLGILLALGRTSKMPIFRLMSTTYIEVVRGVPLITWLLVAFIMLPVALPPGVEIGGVARAIGAMTFFNAAYMAENVRGGLQSVGRGQYEAAQAMGLTTTQTTVFISLPQALKAVIPAIVGQTIALFKDTSLVTIVGLFDFLHIARVVIPSQTQPFVFLGTIKETLLFAAVVYWMFTFSFSRMSLRLEKKLGVGER
ncbi:MAG: amino acid ABC transporter permease [Acidobacteria bacterium]|nr:amino acid ABC transporter permease [Acidobacteriota bacterium]